MLILKFITINNWIDPNILLESGVEDTPISKILKFKFNLNYDQAGEIILKNF